MQAKKQTFLDFARRIDALTAKLGVRLDDIPAKLGISRASLFSYRSGKSPISNKAWQKLELAERRSGIALHEQMISASEERKKALLAAASAEEILHLFPPDSRKRIATAVVDVQLDSIQSNLMGFFRDAEALANLVKTKGSKADLKYFAQMVSQSVRSSRDMLEILIMQLRTVLGLDARSLADRLRDLANVGEAKGPKTSAASNKRKSASKQR